VRLPILTTWGLGSPGVRKSRIQLQREMFNLLHSPPPLRLWVCLSLPLMAGWGSGVRWARLPAVYHHLIITLPSSSLFITSEPVRNLCSVSTLLAFSQYIQFHLSLLKDSDFAFSIFACYIFGLSVCSCFLCVQFGLTPALDPGPPASACSTTSQPGPPLALDSTQPHSSMSRCPWLIHPTGSDRHLSSTTVSSLFFALGSLVYSLNITPGS